MKIFRIIAATCLACACASAAAAQSRADVEQARSALRTALNAFQDGKAQEYRAAALQLVALRPDFPTGIYVLAQAYARTGETEAALTQLEQLVRMGLEFGLADDTVFAKLTALDRFRAIVEKEHKNTEPMNRAVARDSFGGSTFHPDGISFDATTKRFCLGSVRQRKVMCRNTDGSLREYGTTAKLWSVLGTAFAPNGHLWLATTALPETAGFTTELRGRTALVEIDGANDSVLTRIEPPADTLEHSFGDITVAPDGTVFVSDGAGTLYRAVKGKLEAVGTPQSWVSPQGIAVTPDGKQLFVADYSRGLFRVDLATGSSTQLQAPPRTTLLGIDGLSYDAGTLIAIQNGIRPYRVVRLRLDEGATKITALEVLEASHTLFDEPTTGVVVRDRYYFIGNSHWPSFEGGKTPKEPLSQPIILMLPIR